MNKRRGDDVQEFAELESLLRSWVVTELRHAPYPGDLAPLLERIEHVPQRPGGIRGWLPNARALFVVPRAVALGAGALVLVALTSYLLSLALPTPEKPGATPNESATPIPSTHGTAGPATLTTPSVLTVDLPAASATGVALAINQPAGTVISVEASGTWCMGGTGKSAECGGADGIRPANRDEDGLILPGAKIGTLIGRWDDGEWFVVGSGATLAVPDGQKQLVLLFNDRALFYGDNSRSLAVRLTL